MKEMQQSGQNSLGDLNGIANEMDEVIKDLQRRSTTGKLKRDSRNFI